MHTTPTWKLRAPARADANEITELIRSANIRVSGEPDFEPSDLEAHWGLAGFDLERHAFVATVGGAIVAYAWYRPRRPYVDYDADHSLLPDHSDPDLERGVIEELERRVRADAAARPPGSHSGAGRPLLHVHANEAETDRTALYESQGFESCRWFFQMGIELERAPERLTPPPEGIEIRSCRRGVDEPRFYDVLHDAFRDHYRFAPLERDDWVHRHTAYDFYVPGLWLLAWHGAEPVGAACNLLYPDTGWLDELGVRKDWRGKKLGRALLDATFAAFWKHGQPRVRLAVDAGNETGATQLYERAGMKVLKKHVLFRKELGPERPLSA